MPIQIGASAHSFSDPTALLSDCHRRIEMFLKSLESVAENSHEPLTEDARVALERSLRYFREAAPKHTADEEESLFPRLRLTDDAQLRSVLEKLDALEHDHRWAEPLHAIVDTLGQKYLQNGRLNQEESRRLRDSVRMLSTMYQRHIETEDKQLFPLASQALSTASKQEIASEMARRRGVSPAKEFAGTQASAGQEL
jgi:hemerythrin-like domain-containing protein